MFSVGMPITNRLKHCIFELNSWKKTNRNGLKDEIANCRKELNKCRDQDSSTDPNHVTSLRKRMTKFMIQEDKYWRQWAKTHWYRDGDLDTKTFHAAVTSRKKVNHIISL